MNRSPGGRKVFVTLLVAIVTQGQSDPAERQMRQVVDAWEGQSYGRFLTDWVVSPRQPTPDPCGLHPIPDSRP